MAITRTPMVDDDGTGTTGTVINNAWKQQLYDQIDAADAGLTATLGIWTAVPYSAANFVAAAGTWTTNAAGTSYHYSRVQKILFLNLLITQGSLSAASANVTVTLPETFVTAAQIQGFLQIYQASAWGSGLYTAPVGSRAITCYANLATTAFIAGTLYLVGSVTIPIQ